AESAGAAEPTPAQHKGAAGVLDAAAVRRVWDEILSTVREQSQRVGAVVREATVREVEGDTLVLMFRHTVHADMLTKAPDVLTKSVTQVLGGTWQVRCEVGGGQGPRGAGGGRAANSQEPPTAQVGGAVAGHPAPSPRSARSAPTGQRSNAPDTEGDDGWPTPARPGG